MTNGWFLGSKVRVCKSGEKWRERVDFVGDIRTASPGRLSVGVLASANLFQCRYAGAVQAAWLHLRAK
jgi:hypothetical protein